MESLKITKKAEKEYNRRKRLERFKNKINMLRLRLFGKSIPSNDKNTLQAHRDGEGQYRDYYIENGYLQEGTGYTCVREILADSINQKYIYIGLVQGADNAEGVLESNIPLHEIVANINGNIALQEILSKSKATAARSRYYDRIGEEEEPLENHYLYFGKPGFPLGRIEKGPNGKFKIIDESTQEVEAILEGMREEDEEIEAMQETDSIEFNLGKGLVVAKQDCWLEPGKGIQFGGINSSAIQYEFIGGKSIKTSDGKYAYIGEVKLGRGKTKQLEDGKIKFITPSTHRNVVVWSDKNNIIQYFLEKKFAGLVQALGETFTDLSLSSAQVEDGISYIGGITLDEEGKCNRTKEIPESVKEAIRKEKKEAEQSNIISFDDLQH